MIAFSLGSWWTVKTRPTNSGDRVLEIPPTAVGGLFRSNLQTAVTEFFESHQRQLVDCSDPASEKKRHKCKGELSLMGTSREREQAGSEKSTNCRWWDLASA